VKLTVNIEDIARLAGVSRSTVSRVINGHSDVNAQTREVVLRVIEEHNYRPNHAARTLVTQRSRIIGILLPQPPNVLMPFYFPTLLEGIGDTTHVLDYASLLWWGQSGEEEERYTRRILQKNQLMEGLIIATYRVGNPIIERLVETRIPFVMVERPAVLADKVSFVGIDNVQAAQVAVEHLISLGRRRIGHVSGQSNNVDAMDRAIGYRRALEAHGLPFDPNLLIEGEFNHASGYQGMRELLRHGVDAVFASNDEMALGAMQALEETGAQVPDDIAVVGFDDLFTPSAHLPQLTTVRHPVREKGGRAAELLIGLIEGTVTAPQHIILPTQLVIRQSCGAKVASPRRL
jgi:LacI family transcriptional regulator, galactose operon repressor